MQTVRTGRVIHRTHNDAPAATISKELQLRRAVLSCLLWEKTFYENGIDIANRIKDLVFAIRDNDTIIALALEAKNKFHLRHIPLYLTILLIQKGLRGKKLTDLVYAVIQRADEIPELLALYWKDKKCPIANALKKGLALSFNKFDEYQLAKYNRHNKNITLRDVMFLVRPMPINNIQAKLFAKLANNQLDTPDTWEVAISGAKNEIQKSKEWNRLVGENKLGGLALLRNLRNMQQYVKKDDIIKAIEKNTFNKVLPFRFISAAKYAPFLEKSLEAKMLLALDDYEQLKGKTALLVDVSGSMQHALSAKSDLLRLDAANGLGILLREVAEDIDIYSFSKTTVEIPNRHGFALADAIQRSQIHGSTYLGAAVKYINSKQYDRLIVLTDEQSDDPVPAPKARGYMINIATDANGVGYKSWIHIDGFSENVISYILELEKEGL